MFSSARLAHSRCWQEPLEDCQTLDICSAGPLFDTPFRRPRPLSKEGLEGHVAHRAVAHRAHVAHRAVAEGPNRRSFRRWAGSAERTGGTGPAPLEVVGLAGFGARKAAFSPAEAAMADSTPLKAAPAGKSGHVLPKIWLVWGH